MIALWILPLLAVGASAIVCTPNICDTVKCRSMDSMLSMCKGEDKYVKEHGGFCGCCHACITLLDEGDSCRGELLEVPDLSECKPGTTCNRDTYECEALRKKRATGPCAEKRERLQQKIENSEHPLLGLTMPTCDEDGFYTPRQCVEAVCFCVDKEGKQLKDYRGHITQKANMSCKCAREEDMLKHLLGKRVYCTSSGNYKGLQCVGSKCACVDSKEGTAIGESVNIGDAGKLNC